MKQRPILFSTPMVQAILAGRKTQTRRVVKPQPIVGLEKVTDDFFFDQHTSGIEPKVFKCPYGQVGDVLWVRETWQWDWVDFDTKEEKCYFFKASTLPNFLASGERWKPSIHMPKDACRIWLRITKIHVERLHDISEEDAIMEGVQRDKDGWKAYDIIEKGPHKETPHPWNAVPYKQAYHSFKSLWESINGVESWNSNPWVWVIEFEKIEKP